ncbi:hypothetical protein RHMOL_Rhmol09G0098000 [Rhododendron molle]|uniref:Uncharacterized protein n=1 Tax=Rhododendron molle TaxID=49168 RepID=A0ACC0MBN1_RHOML|nr:hypothetical protein RHMOL_Rhmol09G0098000 [Rhododendron molle]
MHHRVILGKIPISDGPTNAFTIISGRWVGLGNTQTVPLIKHVEKLAEATEGYSESDLKNLCIAAAYRPVQELLEEEKKGDSNDVVPILRALNLDDFIQSKAKVGASVAYDATSQNELRKWNEQYGEGGSRRKSPFGF